MQLQNRSNSAISNSRGKGKTARKTNLLKSHIRSTSGERKENLVDGIIIVVFIGLPLSALKHKIKNKFNKSKRHISLR